MATVKGFTEFSETDIKKQADIAKATDDEQKRERARRLMLEMMAYNARALRGDFDTY